MRRREDRKSEGEGKFPEGKEAHVRRRGITRFLAVAAALSLVAAACRPGAGPRRPTEGLEGGTLRIEMTDFVMDCGFDPTCEFVSYWLMVNTNVFLRPLMNYRHVEGDAGGEILPDLAADLPEVSDDGLTYTFTLRDGVMFGPPVSREVTSQDVAYAFQRMSSESQAAQYASYYEGTIEGLEVQDAPAEDVQITGIETPDDKTIVFRLAQETPDFLFRLAMPATAPIPREVASCFTQSAEYGRFAISSSSYMLEGSDQLDISSCDAMEPISGFDPNRQFVLVRNPNYDAATDDPEVRSNLPDRIEITINTNVDDIFARIEAGEVETAPEPVPPELLRKYADDRERLALNPVDVTWYITMNLTAPPFDDLAVRRAVNFVLDKSGLQRAWGGPLVGEVATHIIPPTMGGLPAEEYDPYPSPDHAGDVEAAKEEMRQSKYDSDGDGVCDAPECRNVLHINRNIPPWTEYGPIIEDNLSQIGIELRTRELESGTAYTTIQSTSRNVPIASNAGWGKDWADPRTFTQLLFTGAAIQREGNVNYSLVGVTPEINEEGNLGVTGTLERVPSIDEQFNACDVLPLGQGRTDCFNDLDRTLMEEVAPWVPYRWAVENHLLASTVTQWEFDQAAGEMALAHMAVQSAGGES